MHSNVSSELNVADVVAIEAVDKRTGDWRWSIASVESVGSDRLGARAVQLRAWEPVSRSNLNAEERAEAVRLEKEANRLVAECAEEKEKVAAAQARLAKSRATVDEELANVEGQLAHILPMLDAARAKVATIDAKHLREIRGYKSPPTVVRRVMQLVQVLLGEPPRAVGNWDQVKAMMAQNEFITQVQFLDPAELTDVVVQRFLDLMHKEFGTATGERNRATKTVSTGTDNDALHQQAEIERAYRASAAAGPLMEWAYAMWEFLDAMPAETKEVLKRLPQLRAAHDDLKRSADEMEAKLDAATRKRAEAEERAGRIRMGPAGAFIDHGNRTCLPFVLLHPVDRMLTESSSWRPVQGPSALTMEPRSLVLLRLRAAKQQQEAAAGEGTESSSSSAVGLGVFWLTPDMVATASRLSTASPSHPTYGAATTAAKAASSGGQGTPVATSQRATPVRTAIEQQDPVSSTAVEPPSSIVGTPPLPPTSPEATTAAAATSSAPAQSPSVVKAVSPAHAPGNGKVPSNEPPEPRRVPTSVPDLRQKLLAASAGGDSVPRPRSTGSAVQAGGGSTRTSPAASSGTAARGHQRTVSNNSSAPPSARLSRQASGTGIARTSPGQAARTSASRKTMLTAPVATKQAG